MTMQSTYTTFIPTNVTELQYMYGITYIWLGDTIEDLHTNPLTGEYVNLDTSEVHNEE